MNGAIYIRNRNCRCQRCLAGMAVGPLVMITIGVLFLLENFTRWDFGDTWPLLLIVLGGIGIAKRSASTEGHIQPGWAGIPMVESGTMPPPPYATVPPQPGPGQPPNSNPTEVNRG
jgi:hypothetical protein